MGCRQVRLCTNVPAADAADAAAAAAVAAAAVAVAAAAVAKQKVWDGQHCLHMTLPAEKLRLACDRTPVMDAAAAVEAAAAGGEAGAQVLGIWVCGT